MFALKRIYMPPVPTVNKHNYLLTIMLLFSSSTVPLWKDVYNIIITISYMSVATLLYYLAQYSTTLKGYVQYHHMTVLTLPFSFTFVSMTITAGRTSQIICQKSETVSGVGPAGGHTHTTVDCSIIIILQVQLATYLY